MSLAAGASGVDVPLLVMQAGFVHEAVAALQGAAQESTSPKPV